MSFVVCAAVFAFAACEGCGGTETGIGTSPGTGGGQVNLTLQQVVTGLARPVYLTSPSNDSRLFVVEQEGRIRIINSDGQLLSQPFLDITNRVGATANERGLLSVVFHPQYVTNGFLYVNYTNLEGDTRIERFTRSAANPNVADPNSGTLILAVDQPFSNHNGGHLLFGPHDGMLYIPLGDGGSGGDPGNRAQNPDSLLGKLLRINVNSGNPYSIPSDNPFSQSGGRGEIWALGLRNPWRAAFDRGTNLLFIADVGQGAWEEINAVSRTDARLNYGWPTTEGNACFRPSSGCNMQGLTMPVHVYARSGGNCSVTGGYVYRGSAISEIQGHYFFSDYCAGGLRSLTVSGGAAQNVREWTVPATGNVSSFGEDANGELYVVSHGGTIWRIVRAP
jgi:glucose/arabinose dehydrogenase